MKRFHYALKYALVMIAIFSATFASAELKRVPDPGPVAPTAEQIEFKKSRDGFLNFLKEFRSHNTTSLEGTGDAEQPKLLRQRPEKIMRSAWDPQGNIYAVVPNFDGMTAYGDAFYGKLNLQNGTFSPVWRNSILTNQMDAFLQSGFVRNDILYIPTYSIDMITQDVKIYWKRFDLYYGKALSTLEFPINSINPWKMYMYGMTYDPVHDIVYGLSYDDSTGQGGTFVRIDCSKPEEEWDGEVIFNAGGSSDNWMAGICYEPLEDIIYGLTSQGTLCEIVPDRKAVVTLNEYDSFDDFCFPPFMQTTPMCYSPHDKAIIFHTGQTNGIYSVNSISTETYEAVFLSQFVPQSQVATLYCTDAFAQDEAPAIMANPNLNFKDNDLKGTYSFTAPDTYFNGIALDKNVTLHVLLDGAEILTKEVKPGETVSNEITLSQGLHIISGYCSLGALNGPTSSSRIYIGNDQPYAPTGLKLMEGVLTWKTPINKGVNNAYLDLSNVTYDVYIEGEKQNAEPIKGNSYTLNYNKPAAGKMGITVTATANGVTSDHSAELRRVLGEGYSIPVSFTPTQAQSTLFETLNANNDIYAWEYCNYSGQDPYFQVHTSDYTQKPDDWLFLPPMNFSSTEEVYQLLMKYVNARENAIQKDNMEIWIGSDPLPEAMTKQIYSHTDRIQQFWTELDIRFSVPTAGTYFIGIHSMPGQENVYRGIRLRDFRVIKANGTSGAPGELTDIKLTAAPMGELFATAEITFPTKDMQMNDLPKDQDVTLVVSTAADSKTLTGKPGDKQTVTLASNVDGYCEVAVASSNEKGEGTRQYFSVYTGIDNPLAPSNVRTTISADNLTLSVDWDEVGTVGEHGGYVDPSGVAYSMYYNNSTEFVKHGDANGTHYDYKVGAALPQTRINIVPVAENYIGISSNGTNIIETIGKLYQTPMIEEWGFSEFNLVKWLFNTTAPFNNVAWEHMTDADEDTKGITFGQGGAIRAYNNGGGTHLGELRSPRLTTKTDPKLGCTLKYWNNSKAGKMELWGRTFKNQEFRKIAELTPNGTTNRWEEWEAQLPEDFCQQEWIQINVRVELGTGQTAIIDSYKIAQTIENDFQLTSIESPYSVMVGEEPTYTFTMTNNGTERGTGTLTVDILGDGNLLEHRVVESGNIQSGADWVEMLTFQIPESYTKYRYLELEATATANGDQNTMNDTKLLDILLYDNALPVVRDLTAERADGKNEVNLSWSTPDNKEKGLDSAEAYAAFTNSDHIGPWGTVDVDGKEPFTIQNKRWNGDDKPSSWTVYDAQEMKTMDEPRLSPRSGSKMLLARSVAYDTSTDKPTRAMDFLISPEVKGGTKVSFWLNTLDSQYAETIAIFYSTTDKTVDGSKLDLQDKETAPRECGSFRWLRNFTKSGSETWEACEFTLPADAKYFAFVYSSFGMFGAAIDDIVYTPVEPATMTIDSYDVFVAYDGGTPEVAGRDITGNAFTHASTDGREATYFVKTNVVENGQILQSAFSNPAKVSANAIEGIGAGQYVKAAKGQIIIGGAAGQNVVIADVDGRVIKKSTLVYDPHTFTLDAGIYLVTLGDKTVKVVVK